MSEHQAYASLSVKQFDTHCTANKTTVMKIDFSDQEELCNTKMNVLVL